MDARLARSDNAPIGGGTARGAARNGAQPRRDVFDQRNATQRTCTRCADIAAAAAVVDDKCDDVWTPD